MKLIMVIFWFDAKYTTEYLYKYCIYFRCKKWIQNTRRADLIGKTPRYLYANCVLSTNHFDESQFMNKVAKNRSVWNAVATIFDVHKPPYQISCKIPLPVPRVCREPPLEKQKTKHDLNVQSQKAQF